MDYTNRSGKTNRHVSHRYVPLSGIQGYRSLAHNCKKQGQGMQVLLISVLTLLLALVLGAGDYARSQTPAVCSNTPGEGQRIECTEGSTSTNDIDIDVRDADIDTSGYRNYGISGLHEGTGDISIDAKDVDIDAGTGIGYDQSYGIYGLHKGTGDISIDAEGVDIYTEANASNGIYGLHEGTGDIDIKVKSTSSGIEDIPPVRNNTIKTKGLSAPPITARHRGGGSVNILVQSALVVAQGSHSSGVAGYYEKGGVGGNLTIIVEEGSGISTASNAVFGDHQGKGELEVRVRGDTNIETRGRSGSGIYAIHQGTSGPYDSFIIMNNSTIVTGGARAFAIRNFRQGGMGNSRTKIYDSAITTFGDSSATIYASHNNTGNIDIEIEGGTARTRGVDANALFALHQGNGDIIIQARNHYLETRGTETNQQGSTSSNGILAYHQSDGDIMIDTRGGSITTKGVSSNGILAYHVSDGDITIDTRDGHAITLTGAGNGGHGIAAYNLGQTNTKSIAITVGGTIVAERAGALGVRLEGAAPDENGFRKQTVTVNGSVTGEAAGVLLVGGGRVIIGPRGSVGATSGIAILATGDTPALVEGNPPTKPKLRVDLNLAGRRVAQAIGNDWIINDGGKTTIYVNNIKLHDGETGVTGRTAPNGAWRVSMRAEGVTVTDRTSSDPENWDISEPAAGVIVDRDFSAEDFNRHRPPPPPPPMCPEGQTGTPPNCVTPPPPVIIEEYAARAAVYEALPGFLLKLNARSLSDKRLAWPGSPIWLILSGARGSHKPESASVGAEYDFSRFSGEAGLDIPIGENSTGSISFRHVRGSGNVYAPTGGGKIEASGTGLTLDISLNRANAYYARGLYSLVKYSADLSSDELGRLETGVGAYAHALDLEIGKRITAGTKMNLTPRARLTRSEVNIKDFTDTVNSHVSVNDASRFTGSLGVLAETAHPWKWQDGTLSLHGSLDLEQILDKAETTVQVSGESLSSEPTKSRLLLGLGGTYRRGRSLIGMQVSTGGIGPGDTQYSGQLTFGMNF